MGCNLARFFYISRLRSAISKYRTSLSAVVNVRSRSPIANRYNTGCGIPGDAGSSIPDIGGPDDALDSDMEVVDLSARYEIEETLGKGGMGEVLLAPDDRLFSHRSRQRSDGLGVVPLRPVWRANYSIELSTRRKYIRPPALTRPGKG